MALFQPVVNPEEYRKHFKFGDQLTDNQREQLFQLVCYNRDRFALEGDALGQIKEIEHTITLKTGKPIDKKPYRLSHFEQQEIERQVKKMLTQGIIKPSKSEYRSPVVLVGKKDNTIRFCVDYRALNADTIDDRYPIPDLWEGLTLLGNNQIFSTMDVHSCYWQVKMAEDSKDKTAFVCHLGLFEFNVMAYGLKTAPMTCARALQKIFRDEHRKICYVYYDDLIAASQDFEEHIDHLQILFDRMREFDLKLKPSKCKFGYITVEYLGHVVTGKGISPDPNKVSAIEHVRRPRNIRDVRAFLGLTGFYRSFIFRYSSKATPLTTLLKKNQPFEWTEKCEQAFHYLKTVLITAPVLAHYDHELPLELRVDASGFGIGGVLVQLKEQKPQPILYVSRKLKETEKKFMTTEREALAVVWMTLKLRHYLYGRHFTVVTDHRALTWLMEVSSTNGRLTRWSLQLQGFDFNIRHVNGDRLKDADFLSRYPDPNCSPDLSDFEAEDHTAKMDPLLEKAKPINRTLINTLKDPMEELTETDSTLRTVDFPTPTTQPIDLPNSSTRLYQEEDQFCKKKIDILEDRIRVKPKVEKKTKRMFVIHQQLLYKRTVRGLQTIYALVVPKALVTTVLKAVHEGAAHLGRDKCYSQVKTRFYWPTMYTDVANHVQTCNKCQMRKTKNRQQYGDYQPIPVEEIPFKHISLDLVGPINESVNGHTHIVVINDRLTKYAIAIPIYDPKEAPIMRILRDHVFLVFGIPDTLTTDRGSNLTSKFAEDFLSSYRINHIRTCAYHPEGNGQTECFNRVLGTALAILSENRENWDSYVRFIVYNYNVSKHRATQETPFYLLFGRKPRLDIEVDLGRIELTDRHEVREETIRRMQISRRIVVKTIEKVQNHNRIAAIAKCKRIDLKVGDKVIKYEPEYKKQAGGKLNDRFSGPYQIFRRHSAVTFVIIPVNGEKLFDVVHANRLYKYHEREVKPERREVLPFKHRNRAAKLPKYVRERPIFNSSQTIEPQPDDSSENLWNEITANTDLSSDEETARRQETHLETSEDSENEEPIAPRVTRVGRQQRPPKRYGDWLQ